MAAVRNAAPVRGQAAGSLPWRFVGAVVPGTLLNPLNSSMIAVALVSLRGDFRVDTATATWLVSGFYLAASIGMPLMGRLADQFGPRRVFCAGMLLVALTSVLSPLAPAFGWLLVLRLVQAFGTSAPFPSALAIFRSASPAGKAPASALGVLAIAASVSAAMGPVIGGFLVALAGWQAIFLVNIPFVVVGVTLAVRWLPPDAPRAGMAAPSIAHLVDLPGIVLFSVTLASLLGFLLSLSGGIQWPLLPVALVAGAGLIVYERRTEAPFLDVKVLAANRRLSAIYAQFAAVNVVFYAVFFGLPLWLEEARHYNSGTAGLLMLPVAGVGILVTPLAARLIGRVGTRPALIAGAVALLAGSFALLVFQDSTPVVVILLVGAILGIPNGFNNLGMQAALYDAAPPEAIGAAGGLFQTCRYLGAILATSLLGIIFSAHVTSTGLHTIAAVVTTISLVLVVASVSTGHSRQPRSAR